MFEVKIRINNLGDLAVNSLGKMRGGQRGQATLTYAHSLPPLPSPRVAFLIPHIGDFIFQTVRISNNLDNLAVVQQSV